MALQQFPAMLHLPDLMIGETSDSYNELTTVEHSAMCRFLESSVLGVDIAARTHLDCVRVVERSQ